MYWNYLLVAFVAWISVCDGLSCYQCRQNYMDAGACMAFAECPENSLACELMADKTVGGLKLIKKCSPEHCQYPGMIECYGADGNRCRRCCTTDLCNEDWHTGLPGPQGPRGPPGTDGRRGEQGLPGEAGTKGRKGEWYNFAISPIGNKGESGRPGFPGMPGHKGLPGESGERGLSSPHTGRPGLPGERGEDAECNCTNSLPTPAVAFDVRPSYTDVINLNMGAGIDNNNNNNLAAFTAPVNGTYFFKATSTARGSSAVPLVLVRGEKIVMTTGRSSSSAGGTFPLGTNQIALTLQAGETVSLRVKSIKSGFFGTVTGWLRSPSDVTFSGHLLFENSLE